MKISLVVTTQGNRKNEFKRFIDSINNQIYKTYELVIVDQSSSTITKEILLEYPGINNKCKVIKTGSLPLSKARNTGLKYITGEIVAFPDDDCWYSEDLLLNINKEFEENSNVDTICLNVYDPINKEYYGKNRNVKFETIEIDLRNICIYPISVGIFSRVKTKKDIFFDEWLGAGTDLGSGEETDMLIRLYNNGYKMMFNNKFSVFHPKPDYSNLIKTAKYSKGFGATIRKNLSFKNIKLFVMFIELLIKSFGGSLVYLIKDIQIAKGYFLRGYYNVYGFLIYSNKKRGEV